LGDYRVNLDIFAGPLDLLLYLVRKEEVDIYDIPLAKITEQYLRYIEMLKSFNIDLAGDFLVMASTLMQIKSAMLLPKADPDQIDAEDLTDPRTELIRQLLEYKKFKDAANLLGAAADEQKERHPRPATIVEQLTPGEELAVDIDQVSVWDLLDAFDSIMEATGGATFDISHITDDTPIDLYQIEILHRLQTEGAMKFEQLFESRKNRVAMVGLFLALLELVRDKLVSIEQPRASETIHLKALTNEPAEQAVQKAILSTAEANDRPPAQTQQKQGEPPIPIEQAPAKSKSPEPIESKQDNIPIVELPPKTTAQLHTPKEENANSIQNSAFPEEN
jgi:segregation and condensation protein A